MEQMKLSQKLFNRVAEYVASEYAFFGVKGWAFKEEADSDHVDLFQKLIGEDIGQQPAHNLGIFSQALKECEIVVRVWKASADSDAMHVKTSLRYTHISGGSNGCDLGLKFLLWNDGKITRSYE